MHSPLLPVAALLALTAAQAHAIFIPGPTKPDFQPHLYDVRYYDRFNGRPGEVGGHSGDMTSLTKADWELSYNYAYNIDSSCDPCHPYAKITITAFHITGRQTTTVFMPNDAPQRLKDHEQAHFDLNSYTYNQALIKARVYSTRMLRPTFEGCNLQEAQNRLNDAFNSEFKDPWSRWRDQLHQALNNADNYGHGGISPQQAYNRVLADNG